MGGGKMMYERHWAEKVEVESIREIIEDGNELWFQYRGKDYFVERGGNGYLIQDPQIGNPDETPYTNYPGHEDAKTPEEFMNLPFLDRRTIFERFEELRFFD
jgi:hypothetical protein